MSAVVSDGVAFDENGLVVGVVQDVDTGRVLMVGYLNEESLALTVETGFVHFWSRSRRELWKKGETSGNFLELAALRPDCDGDALLLLVRPAGPTCHTGAVGCFDADQLPSSAPPGFGFLDTLWAVIQDRAATRPAGSYTVSLLEGGVDAAGRKVTEEATEVLMAAKDHASGGSDERIAEEAADLLYHLLVLLAERSVPAGLVVEALRSRS